MLAKILIGWAAVSVPVALLLGRILSHPHVTASGAPSLRPARTTTADRPARTA